MRISRNNVDVCISPKSLCNSCAFLYRQTPACLLLMIHSYLPCGGEFTHITSEIFEL